MQQRGSPTVAGSLPASMVEKKGGGRLADSPYDNHIRPVRTTVLKLLVEEKRGGGLTEEKRLLEKESSHLALLNCKPQPIIYNDNRQFYQGIHNLLLCI